MTELEGVLTRLTAWAQDLRLAADRAKREREEMQLRRYAHDLSAVIALLSETRAGPGIEREGWRPIETAPRDATEIIALTRRNGVQAAVIVHWADGGGDEQPRFRGWFYSHDYGFAEVMNAPTHWLPLPSPPRSEKP